jgi:hypothetical protein
MHALCDESVQPALMRNLQRLSAYTAVKTSTGRSPKETIICNGITPAHLEEGALYGLSPPDYVMVVQGKLYTTLRT